MEEKLILEIFSKRLSNIINERNMDVSILAQKIGIGKSSIYRYLNQEISPKITTVKVLADVLNVNFLWLMGYDVPMEKNNNIIENYTPKARAIARGFDKLPPEKQKVYTELLKTLLEEDEDI